MPIHKVALAPVSKGTPVWDNDSMNETTMTYTLYFDETGFQADPDTYTSLDEARDIAFEISQEHDNATIRIYESFGASETVVERVWA